MVSLSLGIFNNLAIFIVLVSGYGYLNSVFATRRPLLCQTVMGLLFDAITGYSEAGKGTVFHAYLPLSTKEQQPVGSEEPVHKVKLVEMVAKKLLE